MRARRNCARSFWRAASQAIGVVERATFVDSPDHLFYLSRLAWTGGRVVEGTGLENRRTGNGIVSSNLTLSASDRGKRIAGP